MRQEVRFALYARFLEPAQPLTISNAGGARNGASRLADVRREASPPGSHRPLRGVLVVVAHDHMRQNADIFDLRTFFDGQQNLRPFQKPGVPGMALRDWPMWSSATTGCAPRSGA